MHALTGTREIKQTLLVYTAVPISRRSNKPYHEVDYTAFLRNGTKSLSLTLNIEPIDTCVRTHVSGAHGAPALAGRGDDKKKNGTTY